MLMICRNCYRKMTSTSLPSLVPTRYSDLCTLGEFRLVPLPPFATRFLVRSMRPDPEYARGADAIGYSGFENFGERFRQENLRGHRFSAFDKEMRLKQFMLILQQGQELQFMLDMQIVLQMLLTQRNLVIQHQLVTLQLMT